MRDKGTPRDQPPAQEARLNLRITSSLRRDIKHAAAEQDISMKIWIVRACREKLTRELKAQPVKTYQEEHRDAPKNQKEWLWTYALIRCLRSTKWHGLKHHLSELWKLAPWTRERQTPGSI